VYAARKIAVSANPSTRRDSARTFLIARAFVIKRLFDVSVAACGLVLLLPLAPIIALVVKLDSKGPVFFRQERVGQGFRRFQIYKFRTMRTDAALSRRAITAGHDPRITGPGRLLRKLKIDELPQLINVLMGDMSLVGPRPELPRYVDLFRHEYADILMVRPGMTDIASLKYRDEATLLGQAADPEAEYVRRVLPDKLRLAREYVRRSSLSFDLTLIAQTAWSLTTAAFLPVRRESSASELSVRGVPGRSDSTTIERRCQPDRRRTSRGGRRFTDVATVPAQTVNL
jgi:lipopolysaccharide/colanic/teichoic acid biosynthesis glycosyltransferase